MKKTMKILLCAALCITLTGCGSKKKGDDFKDYLAKLPAIFTKYNNMDINFLFKNPENYGIKKDLYDLDFMSLSDYKEYNKEIEDVLAELDEYNYDSLNKDQKITYDVLTSQAEDDGLDVETEYYLTTNYFDTNSGVQAQLPMSMWNYEFKTQKSYDSYLAILKQAPKLFKKYTDLEKTRQKKGFGMSQTYMDEVVEALDTITTADQSYILEAAYKRIDEASFINAEDKQSSKDKITKAFQESFIPAFAQAEKDLKSIKVQKKGEGELASYKGGKKYYESIVTEASSKNSVKKYMKFLDDEEDRIYDRLGSIVQKYPELQDLILDGDKYSEALTNLNYTSLTTSDQVINYLEGEIGDGKDFPTIKKLDYVMNEIPASMKDTLTMAAAYYISAFDDTSGKDERMILNSTFTQENFTTLAHESFPGHMYQNNYFKTVKHNIMRDLLGSNTYSEGWATYIEDKACDYSEEPATCHLSNINSQLTYLSVLKLDKLIHYDGYSREDAYDYLRENFNPEADEESLSAQYEQLLENPAVFVNYYVGLYRILDIKEKAKDTWGSDYSEYRFNKSLLDLGALPMDLLEKYMKVK